ncbi:MAG: 5-methylcytosine restriction system component-like protein [Bacteroidetes bacterium]|nr:MAG: 5-methylcytosine restriction system component-like protein [Bacteroidota bacterium]
MRNNKPIQVFEHKQLLIGEQGFAKSHWEALGWYNEKHGGQYFSLTPKGVKFNQYVGVIQVGNITIEVLPKISNLVEKGDKAKWQKVLIDMLRVCRWMRVHANDKASLRFKPHNILEAYLELFLQECDTIIHQGLVKKYRSIANNSMALKGKLLFNKQIQENFVHKERFFTRHQVFDRENVFNQILLKALKLIPILSQSPYLKDRVYNLLLAFPELDDVTVSYETFDKLVYDRKTTRYKEAMEIAAMLLLNYRPDISNGQNHVLAILFDMNDLWEEYICQQLIKYKPADWVIRSQNPKPFWKPACNTRFKIVKPDIVIHNQANDSKIIVDTKWKLPTNNIPADADLKQMFVYNEYWLGKNALLLYPHATFTDKPIYIAGEFAKKEKNSTTHACGIMKIAVLDHNNNNLDRTIGSRISNFLEKEKLI